MERKTADFFDWDKVNMSKVMQQFSQHPDKMDQIMEYVISKVEHFTEFRTKRSTTTNWKIYMLNTWKNSFIS